MTKATKLDLLLLCGILLVISCIGVFSMAFAETPMASNILMLDETPVLNDLDGSMVNDEPFDIVNFPYGEEKEPKVIVFAEYCFSYYSALQDNYALYVYLYNPQGITFFDSEQNTIQIGSKYDSKGNVTQYSTYELKLCNFSTGAYANLFYKFKIVDTTDILQRVKINNIQRRYDVSSIELLSTGVNADDFVVANTWIYSGFAQGMGAIATDDSSLSCITADFDVLTLDVFSTYYRPSGENVANSYTQDQLNSVYFAIDNSVLDKYGVLQAVHCKWYEYVTKEIFVTENADVYNALYPYLGQNIVQNPISNMYGFYVNPRTYIPDRFPIEIYYYADSVYNIKTKPVNIDCQILSTLTYLFLSVSIDDDYVLPSSLLFEYMFDYSEMRIKDVLGKYSSDLFVDYVDAGRQRGLNDTTIRSTDNLSLTSYEYTQSWWEKIWGIKNYTGSVFDGIEGICEVSVSDVRNLSKTVFCDKYYIAESDYNEFIEFFNTSNTGAKTVFLLRFSVTDYVSKPVNNYGEVTNIFGQKVQAQLDSNAFMAQQTVFLDFNIIDVTLVNNNVSTVLAVVAKPIDIVSDVTPPVVNDDNSLQSLLYYLYGVLAILVAVVLGTVIVKVIRFSLGVK